MLATTFEITYRPSDRTFGLESINKFQLRETGQVPAETILANNHITLYSLDFENRQAVFVETPVDIDLSQASFYFRTQYENATQILTISFEVMLKLAESIAVDDQRLVFIHSVGRCGSTLASQIFAQVPGVINFSEPDVLTLLVVARNTKILEDDDLIALLEASIRLLCKTTAETAWVIKGRSFVIELGDWLHRLYPQAKNLFLYRDAETWLLSGLRAFGQNNEMTEEEQQARQKERRKFMGTLVPAIAQYDPNLPLPHAGTLSLMWLTAMERYVQQAQMGIEMLAIRYNSWQTEPQKTAEAMLEYCQCKPTDMTNVFNILNKDSQAGTHLSQQALDQGNRNLSKAELEELQRHLQNHAFIHHTDFEVPNTVI